MIECEPALSNEVLNVAKPAEFSVTLPSVEAPSRKFTEPVGTVGFPDGPETVAVNVKGWPLCAGFADEVRDVVEPALTTAFTTCVSTDEAEPVKLVSPPYDAVIE